MSPWSSQPEATVLGCGSQLLGSVNISRLKGAILGGSEVLVQYSLLATLKLSVVPWPQT